jgi:hypothetical protein
MVYTLRIQTMHMDSVRTLEEKAEAAPNRGCGGMETATRARDILMAAPIPPWSRKEDHGGDDSRGYDSMSIDPRWDTEEAPKSNPKETQREQPNQPK